MKRLPGIGLFLLMALAACSQLALPSDGGPATGTPPSPMRTVSPLPLESPLSNDTSPLPEPDSPVATPSPRPTPTPEDSQEDDNNGGAGMIDHPAVQAAVEALVEQTGATSEEIELVEVAAVEWRNSCLGCEKPGEMCLTVITPGYRVILKFADQTYEFHTDRTGRAVRACKGGGKPAQQ